MSPKHINNHTSEASSNIDRSPRAVFGVGVGIAAVGALIETATIIGFQRANESIEVLGSAMEGVIGLGVTALGVEVIASAIKKYNLRD